ncbi:hypothetical protein BDDG_11950 [Blastomyces dermatitidis ATCC 18188]|uniref:Uncharacterized protein n=1 Tax=Ajellomyces dermatitidis (strain ATCC 18188 / CBS 674.68) TaxID=653446 RepID=A0A0J9EPM6_AJEDA|nr:hypothetical protein BDDG_11950 [Blastomyces dermatitidis ATCC 18188]
MTINRPDSGWPPTNVLSVPPHSQRQQPWKHEARTEKYFFKPVCAGYGTSVSLDPLFTDCSTNY